jgi:hypothetical protein
MKQAAANIEEDITQSEIAMDICDLNDVTTLVTNDNCAGETDLKKCWAFTERTVTAYMFIKNFRCYF